MDPNAATELILAAAAVGAVVRLISLGLARQFPALLAYLAFLSVMDFGFGLLDQASALYFWTYIALEPLECIFGIIAVRELFALVFDNYPGIRSLGRWVTYAGSVFALGVSLLLARFFWSGETRGRSIHLFYFEVSQRSIVLSLALVIITILLFLSRYPLHLSKNTLVSSVFFSVLFLCEASRLLVDSLAPQLNNNYVDWTENVLVAVCLLGWSALLKREIRTAPAQIRFSTPQEDHLLQQLNSLNQLMTRAARR